MKIQVKKDIASFLSSWFDFKLTSSMESIFLKYYGNYYKAFGPRMRYFYNRQSEELMKYITSSDIPMKVLEVGSGTGTESLWMALKGAYVLGIDIANDRLELSRYRQTILEAQLGKKLNCSFIKKNVLNLEASDFDVVWVEQAFHHLEPRELIFEKFSKLVKPGGYLIISETNALNPLNQILLFTRRGFKTIKTFTDDNGMIQMYGDERILSANKLERHLLQYKFEIVETNHFRIFPSGNLFERFFIFEKFLPKILRFAFTHYNVVARKL